MCARKYIYKDACDLFVYVVDEFKTFFYFNNNDNLFKF